LAVSRDALSQPESSVPCSSDPIGSQTKDKEGEEEYYLEKAFLDLHIGEFTTCQRDEADSVAATSKIEANAVEAERLAHEEALANGAGIECGCCFGEEVWVSSDVGILTFIPSRPLADESFQEEMFQCSEGHLFCRECATKHTETKLGDQTTVSSPSMPASADVSRLSYAWIHPAAIPPFLNPS